jgi:hypothetical protein
VDHRPIGTRGPRVTLISTQWQSIVRLDTQPVLRNLLVTQGYHELSRGFARMLGPENVTWFSFASWSSKTVGRFLQSAPFEAPFVAALHDTRRFLAKGNTEVFRELAPVFAEFLDVFDADRAPDPAKLERFLSTLQSGSSAPDQIASDPKTHELRLVERGGQALLGEAVRHYYHAKFEPDAKRKAERILLANAHIGVHEQTRLQTYIRGALDAPVRTLFTGAAQLATTNRVGYRLFGPVASDGPAIREQQRRAAMLRSANWASLHAHTLFRRFATDKLLTLKLPDSSVRLGRDLRPAPGHPLFPRVLERIEHPELGSLFARYVPARARIAAEDWASLEQRMRFILELFRSRQRNQRLLEPTFSELQVTAMKSGSVPPGPLT